MSDHQIFSGAVPTASRADKIQAYQPRASSSDGESVSLSIKNTLPDAMDVFLAWERLRLLYNATLFGVVLFWVNPLAVLFLAPFLLEPSIIANLCFCAGPVGEGYLSLIGFDRRFSRWLLFVCGTLVAAGVTWSFMGELVQRLDR